MVLHPVGRVGLVAVLVAACAAPRPEPVTPSPVRTQGALATPAVTPAAAPTLAPARSPAPSPAPAAPSAEPSPTPPPAPDASLPLVAVVEQDGIRVRIELDRNPLPAGRVTWIRMTVRNLTGRALEWYTSCGAPLWLYGEADLPWVNGADQQDRAHRFKTAALEWMYHFETSSPVMRFVAGRWLGSGASGCGSFASRHRLPPHGVVRARRAWDGMAEGGLGPFPSGSVTLRAGFSYRWAGVRSQEPASVELTMPAWVMGRGDRRLSPPEVVDAALADPDFRAYIETTEFSWNADVVLAWRRPLHAWEVGVATRLGHGRGWRAHLVLIHPRTGAVLDTVDRRWDSATERP